MKNIFIGADHRGFELKEKLKVYLTSSGKNVTDLGAHTLDPTDDYVDIAKAVAEKTLQENGLGIVICGSGVGMDITSNKIKGIRCALVFDTKRAIQSREHEDVNILSLASDVITEHQAQEIIDAFLSTPFTGEERHKRRLMKLQQLEK